MQSLNCYLEKVTCEPFVMAATIQIEWPPSWRSAVKTVIPGEPLTSTAPRVRADGSILKDDMSDMLGPGSGPNNGQLPVLSIVLE